MLFTLPVLLTCICLEVLLRNIPNIHELKADYLQNKTENIHTLILGSSHTLYGLNPEEMGTGVFNASNVSQSVDIDLALLKKYEHRLKYLNTVVLRLSYSTLFERLEDTPELWRVKNYRIYYGLNFDQPLNYHFELFSLHLKTNLKRLIAYYFLANTVVNCSEFGWGTDFFDDSGINKPLAAQLAVDRHTAHDLQDYEAQVKAIKGIISICQKHQVKLILLTTPTHKSYWEQLDDTQLNLMFDLINPIVNHYQDCIYLNFMRHADFQEGDFYDADHLNAKGAKKLSELVKGYL